MEMKYAAAFAIAGALALSPLSARADDLVLLSGGRTTIGSPTSERQHQPDETRHDVTLSPFYIDAREVTQRDYEAVMGTNPSYSVGADLPVESVTWYDAVAYCNALSEKNGLTPVYTVDGDAVTWDRSADGYRLPTEAEWEYAARSGTDNVFNGKDHITSDDANFNGNYPYLIEENYVRHRNPDVVTSVNRDETIRVGSFAPNAFGLYDMYGNVSEWCFDYYGAYDASQAENPTGAASGSMRVSRGGSFNDFGKHLRSAYRSAAKPDEADRNTGFRVARNAEAMSGTVVTRYTHSGMELPENPKILVAYFTYSGNVRGGAEIAARRTGGDLFEIRMKTPYRGNIYDVSQADLMKGVRPELASHVDVSRYDVVLLGYPNWWAGLPMPVVTFLEENDFTGKFVVPFCSNGSCRFGESLSDLAKTVPTAFIGHAMEYTYSGGRSLAGDISDWLRANGIKER